MLLFIFIAKYIFCFAAVKKNYSEPYFSLFHELFNDYKKITYKWDWTKCFSYNSPLVSNLTYV